jgi:hypothetical protein
MKQQKPTITQEAVDLAKANAEIAKEILDSEEKQYDFLRTFLRDEKEKIIDEAVNNKLKKRVLKGDMQDVIYERWEQEAEQAGAFKFIHRFIGFLQYTSEYPKEIDKAIKEGRLSIEG